ncbi:hypothetical protein HDU78_010432, partial [Chytriomyces hyalinus]
QVAQASCIFCEILLHNWHFALRHMKFFLTTYTEDEDMFYNMNKFPFDLLLPNMASMLYSYFTDYSYGNDLLLGSSQYLSISEHAGEKIVAFLVDLLDMDGHVGSYA